jgi:hypothetical protein
MLAVGCEDGRLKFYEAELGALLQDFQDHISTILTFLPTPQGLFVSGCDSRIFLYSHKNGKVIQSGVFRGQSHDILAMASLS